MKKILSSIGGILLTIIVWASIIPYPLGIYHSVKKHSTGDVVASIFLPPWGWYRGLEFFWHPKKANAEKYKQHLEVDTKIFAMVCNMNQNGKRDSQTILDISNLTSNYKSYPDEIKTELKRRAQEYCQFVRTSQHDIMKYCMGVMRGELRPGSYIPDPDLNNLQAKLLSYGLTAETESTKTATKLLIEQFEKLDMDRLSIKDTERIQVESDKFLELSDQKLRETYKEIFGESLIMNK